MRVVFDRDRCQGHGLCALFGPASFTLDDLGYPARDEVVVPAGQEDAARRVVANCPERAIRVAED